MTITGRVRGHSLHRTRCLARVFRKSCLEGDGGKAAALTRVDNRGNAYILEIAGKKLFVAQCGMKNSLSTVLMLNGHLTFMQVLEGKETWNELGVKRSISVFCEEELLVEGTLQHYIMV